MQTKIVVKHPGFTLVEALISLTLLGVLAGLLIPLLNDNVGQDKLYQMSINDIAEITSAYSTYSKQQVPTTATSIATILEGNINYVKKITDSSNSTQICTALNADGTCTLVNTIPCTVNQPCLLLQNGALLQYDGTTGPNGTGNFTGSPAPLNPNQNAVHLVLDPDGSGIQYGIPLVLFLNGRISTISYSTTGATPAAFGDSLNNTIPANAPDPEYITAWTNG